MYGKQIRCLRYLKRMTIKEVSDKTGISTVSLSRYERDKSTPKLNQLDKIANFFNVSVDYLTGHEKKITKKKVIKKEICSTCKKEKSTLNDKHLIFTSSNFRLEYHGEQVKNTICFDCLIDGMKILSGNYEGEI